MPNECVEDLFSAFGLMVRDLRGKCRRSRTEMRPKKTVGGTEGRGSKDVGVVTAEAQFHGVAAAIRRRENRLCARPRCGNKVAAGLVKNAEAVLSKKNADGAPRQR